MAGWPEHGLLAAAAELRPVVHQNGVRDLAPDTFGQATELNPAAAFFPLVSCLFHNQVHIL